MPDSQQTASTSAANPDQSFLSNTDDSTAPAAAATTTTTTASSSTDDHHASRPEPAAAAAASAELSRLRLGLYGALRHFADFPIKGIDFIDIMPLFLDPALHESLLRCLELQTRLFAGAGGGGSKPDVVVGLDARGFLFGPSLALRLGASFVPVRKQGKLPGPCVTASYEKEYGADYFQMQQDAIKPGQKVLVVDDIIATGGSAAAAGELVKQLGGTLVGYLFILEIAFLKGREKLGGVPTVTLLEEAGAA